MKLLPKFACIVLALLAAPAVAAPVVGKAAPDFDAIDTMGKPVKLSALKGKTVVLEWTNPGCPFVVKHYQPGHMQHLQAEAKTKDVVWISINSSAEGKEGNVNAETANRMMTESKAVPAHYVLDASGEIGKLYDAKTTPHMFVIDKQGLVAYMGAIDDRPTTDSADIAGARNYVMEAIDALHGGKKVGMANTKPYGCGVKYN